MKTRYTIILIVVMAILISSCSSIYVETTIKPVDSQTASITATSSPVTIIDPTESTTPTQPTSLSPGDISLDYTSVAQNINIQNVVAQPASPEDPYWVGAPQYRLLTFEGYPVTEHKIMPQILVYPLGNLASANENMALVAANLQALLQSHQAADQLPLLPLLASEKQIVDARIQYLDFQNGMGVRYLTQTGNGIVPINSYELIYSFQGLTSDGQCYISALFPVSNSELPTGNQMSEQMAAEIINDPGYYMKYLSTTGNLLDQLPASSFVPDIGKLDALIQSLVVLPAEIATPTPEVFMPVPLEGVLADKAREDLSSRLNMDIAMINVEEITHQDWPDICLGLPPAVNQECTKTTLPGWSIVLNAAGHTYEYRASEDGALISYGGPVTIAGSEMCKINGTSQIYSPEDGYCFAYPVRFHRTDERGPIAIFGPAYGNGPEPLYASLTIEVSSMPESQNLNDAVNTFLEKLGNVPAPQTRLVFEVANEPVLLLEVVSGMLGSRDVFLVHDQKLFHFTFWPAPSVVMETSIDVEDLYQTVLGSLTFTQ